MNRFPHIAQRLFNQPLAVLPEKADMIAAALADRLGIARINGVVPVAGGMQADDDWWGPRETPEEKAIRLRGWDAVGDVAVIPVTGTLVAKLGTARPHCGMQGYDNLRHAFGNAMADPSVRAIAFDCDSPGGEVSGCFDLVDTIFAARGQKPMLAILSEMAASAAYAIASAADAITVPRTGFAGSVGVIAMHVDFSRMLDKEGVTVTLIRHGARKAEGDPYSPLADDVRSRIQAQIDQAGALFIETVARNRGLAPAAVEAWQAECFLGPQALALGVVDAIQAPDQAMAELLTAIAA